MAESLDSASTAIYPNSSNPNSDLSFTANGRGEIDTSAPFESVREAASRFGGFGFWRPPSHIYAFQESVEESDVMELKAQAAVLHNDLIVKERETLEVMKELEATKARVVELSSKLQQENVAAYDEEEDSLRGEEVHGPAGLVLKDLNKAKKRLCKRTVDFAGIRGSVDQLRKSLKEERDALEKTRERVLQKSLKVTSLEEEEVVNAVAEIEQTRENIKTAKIRLVAARKMKEAARAGEAIAVAEIKDVSESRNTVEEVVRVSISADEYTPLTQSAKEAEEEVRKRVEEANVSKADVLKKVDEVAQDTETNKRALEEGVGRVDNANATKLEAEQTLRHLRLENRQRKRSSSVNNTAKFKNIRETTTTTPRLMDVNGLNLTYDVVKGSSSSVSVLKPSMSIGQILSKKLLVTEESDMNVSSESRKISLGQMLANNSDGDNRNVSKRSEGNGKRSATRNRKRKKFGFAKISVLFNKESKKKKKKNIDLKLR